MPLNLQRKLSPSAVNLYVFDYTSFDQVKESLLRAKLMKDNVWCHLLSSSIAGLVAAVVGSPVDVLKTRIMNASVPMISSIKRVS